MERLESAFEVFPEFAAISVRSEESCKAQFFPTAEIVSEKNGLISCSSALAEVKEQQFSFSSAEEEDDRDDDEEDDDEDDDEEDWEDDDEDEADEEEDWGDDDDEEEDDWDDEDEEDE